MSFNKYHDYQFLFLNKKKEKKTYYIKLFYALHGYRLVSCIYASTLFL